MTSGQARVLLLLIVLGILEVVVHPSVKTFLQTAYTNIRNNIGLNNT